MTTPSPSQTTIQPDLSKRPFVARAERVLDAPPTAVFRAWTTRDFERWFAAPGSMTTNAELGYGQRYTASDPVLTQVCDIPGHNAAVFVNSNPTDGPDFGSRDVTITNNLTLGGVYSYYLYPAHGTWIVTGNRVVNGTWGYGAYEANGQCAKVATWSDNTVVTIDASYNVTSPVGTEPCPN